MNFQQLRHFVVTAQAGNIVKAAETLYISQSGLSRSIGALEHLIGLPLFERSPKGVTLTEYGRYFLPGAQLMLNEHRRYVEELKAFRELRAGSLSVGINHSFAYLIVPEAVTSLLKRWPSVNISIVTDNYLALVEQLVTGDVDLALSLYTDASMREDLHYEPLDELRTVTLAREGHPLLDGRAVTMADLAQADWALIKGASVDAAFNGVFEAHGLAMRASA
jgi:DNA-binding transcriptional LysR family regulator